MLSPLPADIVRCRGKGCPLATRKACQRFLTQYLDYQFEIRRHPKCKKMKLEVEDLLNKEGKENCDYFIKDTRA